MIKLFKTLTILLLVTLAACLPGAANSPSQGMTILPALKSAGLSGRLIFIHYDPKGNQLMQLDLSSGQTKTLFAGANKSWLAAAEVSPDGKQILLAYAPPPPNNQVQLAYTDLYLLPVDGATAPKPLLTRKAENESFFQPAWMPDGQSICYTHTVPAPQARTGVESDIECAPVSGGAATTLAKHALWPRPAPDGSKLAYLAEVLNTTDNILSLMNADGSGAGAIKGAEKINIVDAHLFAPDGKSVYFAAISDSTGLRQPSRAPFWTWGVRPVSAHTNPEDWFRVDLASGQVTQLTHIGGVNMAAAFSPDGQQIAFLSQKGLYLMKPDGSGLTQLADGMAMGSLNWVK